MSDSDGAAVGDPAGSQRHPDRGLVVAVVAAVLAVAVAPQVLLAAWRWTTPHVSRLDGGWIDRLRWALVEGTFAAGTFVVGATVGSFLNVVVHRLPLGRSPLAGRSHCPHCGHQIRPHDNIPVVGWLRLGGRCRDCRAPIAARYPIVEVLCGGLLLLLWQCEWASGGANLPGGEVLRSSRLDWLILQPRGELAGQVVWHGAVLLTLLVWSLVAADGGRLPPRHLALVLGLAIAVTTIWPSLHPVALVPESVPGPPWAIRGLAVAIVGLAVGAVGGGLAGRFLGDGWWPTACLALWGAACGWQAVSGTAVVMALLVAIDRLATRLTPWLPLPAPWLVPAAATIHLVAWRWIHTLLFGAAAA